MLPDVTIPASLSALLAVFGPCFTAPGFRTFCALACGFWAQAGRRTVCGMLGGAVADMGASPRAAQVSAAALISPVIQLAEVVAANERRFQVGYPWSDTSRAVAARFDFVSRAGEIAARDPQPAILLVTGAEDDPAFPLQAQRLQTELRRRYDDPERVGLATIPAMKHAFAAEPGIEPAPQTAEAKLVDAAVTDWLRRYLR